MPAAARSLEQALDHAAQAARPEHADVAVTLVELGRVYQDGFNERAEPLHARGAGRSGGRCSATSTGKPPSA